MSEVLNYTEITSLVLDFTQCRHI